MHQSGFCSAPAAARPDVQRDRRRGWRRRGATRRRRRRSSRSRARRARSRCARAGSSRREVRRVLLEEALSGDAVGIAREHHRPVVQVGQEPRRDRAVVLDQVALGVSLLGPEDLVEVAEGTTFSGARRTAGGPAARRRRRVANVHSSGGLSVAEAQERRLPQQAILGRLLVADLDDELRLDPDVCPAPRGTGPPHGGVGDAQALELLAGGLELLLAEAAADAPDVDEAAVAGDREVQRAEAGTRALAPCVKPTTAKSPVRSTRTFFQSRKPPAAVRRRPRAWRRCPRARARARSRTARAPCASIGSTARSTARLGNSRASSFLRSTSGSGRRSKLLEGEQVEERRASRAARPRRARCRAARCSSARFCSRWKLGRAGLVEDHDLAVERRSDRRARDEQRAGELGKHRGRVGRRAGSGARGSPSSRATSSRKPSYFSSKIQAGSRERLRRAARPASASRPRRRTLTLRRAEPLELAADLRRALGRARQLLDVEAGEDRRSSCGNSCPRRRSRRRLLDQQPLLAALALASSARASTSRAACSP